MKKVIRLTESELIDMVKRIINEQGTIMSAPQKPEFPKHPELDSLPSTTYEGKKGKKLKWDNGETTILFADGTTNKKDFCWCLATFSGVSGIIGGNCATVFDVCSGKYKNVPLPSLYTKNINK